METPVVESTPSAPATPEAPVETTLAEHEAQFGPKATPPVDDDMPEGETPQAREPKKPRAAKQVASGEDAPRIQELTRKLRDAERERDELRQRSAAQSMPTSRPPSTATAQPYAVPEPTRDQFATADDSYAAWMDARQDWRLGKVIHDAQQAVNAQRQTEAQQRAAAEGEQLRSTLSEKITSYEQANPGFMDRLDAVDDIRLPDILAHTIATLDNPPELMDYFATHPDDYVDAIGFAASLELSDSSVALLRRKLNRYSRATDAPRNGATGAPKPAASLVVAPKPPTPVRTGPLKTGDEPPGDNDMSLANHEKFFGRKRRP